MLHPVHDDAGPHLDEDRVLDLLLDLPPERELEAIGRHLARCRRCEDLLRHRGAQMERRRACGKPQAWPESDVAAEGSEEREWKPEPIAASRTPERPERGSGRDWRAETRRWLAGALWHPRYAIGLGVGGLIILGLLSLTVRPHRTVSPPLVAEWLPSAAETLNLRNNPDQEEFVALSAALRAYDRRDLPAAIQALSAVHAIGAMDNLRLVFLGSALTQAGDYPRAVRILRSCSLDELPEPWRGEGGWTLLVALRLAGYDGAADSLARVLAKQEGTIGVRARCLLRSQPPDASGSGKGLLQ